MNEIFFVVEEASEGGYIAKALNASIIAQTESTADLHIPVRDAVHCHFDKGLILLHFVRDEVIAA